MTATHTTRPIDNVTRISLSGRTPRPPFLDEERIAHMTDDEITRMSRDQLVDRIRAARLPVIRKDVNRALPHYDRETLERLVFLIRRCCYERRGNGGCDKAIGGRFS